MRKANLIQFLNDMKSGVYNYTDNGKCINCGNCCTSLLPVTNDELKAIKRYIKKKHIKPYPRHKDVSFDLTCPFRNDVEKKCNIYEVRPQICRDFKCDKPQRMIECSRDGFEYDARFHSVNLRSYFGE